MAVASVIKQYEGAIDRETAELVVGMDQYLTGDGQGSWETAPSAPKSPPETCGPDARRRLSPLHVMREHGLLSLRRSLQEAFTPTITRPLLLSKTTGVHRNAFAYILSENTFAHDRFQGAMRCNHFNPRSIDAALHSPLHGCVLASSCSRSAHQVLLCWQRILAQFEYAADGLVGCTTRTQRAICAQRLRFTTVVTDLGINLQKM